GKRLSDDGRRLRGPRCGGHVFERIYSKRLSPFLNPDPVIRGNVFNFLHQTTRPANLRSHRTLDVSEPEEDILTMLRQKTGAGLHSSRLLARWGGHRNRRADRIAIALFAL